MQTYSYDVTIKEDGCLDLHTKIPEIKGEKVRIIVVASIDFEVSSISYSSFFESSRVLPTFAASTKYEHEFRVV